MSRASSRKSRPESSGSRLERFGPGSDHSESDDEIPHKPREHLPEIADFTTVDINDEKAFDTDLEDKGTSLLLLKGQSIVIMIPKTSPVVFIRKYFIFSNPWCLFFFIECLKEIYANVFFTPIQTFTMYQHTLFFGAWEFFQIFSQRRLLGYKTSQKHNVEAWLIFQWNSLIMFYPA